ncbi:MAG: 3-dehydroquinate synthase [Gammaproteobacteria bacterium RIFCSPHIGHO2_12_FULL_40_19]|nr:MAG: 3-dehydroquinate synthase [Gammaproteobacteria bacterium RIFCSPHIGHO2_12_FULL_40_19]
MILSVTHATGAYPIFIGENILSDAKQLRGYVNGTQVFIVTDDNVAPHYLSKITAAFSEFQCDTLTLPPGELSKTLRTFEKIIDACIATQHHRDTTFIALGGGVVGDIAGFAAACYQRGVSWLQIPTTLLAQVDASIGGKTAVNHGALKNFVGAFHQPSAVFIDTETLNTLPAREFRAGVAEIIKAALIADAVFFEWLEKNMGQLLLRDPSVLRVAIQKSCAIKGNVVMLDEKEKNLRMTLNLGHTFAHAIETVLGFNAWLHGEAVAYGICVAATLSHQLGLLSLSERNRIHQCFIEHNLLRKLPGNAHFIDLTNTMQSDKKVKSNRTRLVLLSAVGNAVISDQVTTDQVMAAWQEFSMLG